jgi:hypothetical protein
MIIIIIKANVDLMKILGNIQVIWPGVHLLKCQWG